MCCYKGYYNFKCFLLCSQSLSSSKNSGSSFQNSRLCSSSSWYPRHPWSSTDKPKSKTSMECYDWNTTHTSLLEMVSCPPVHAVIPSSTKLFLFQPSSAGREGLLALRRDVFFFLSLSPCQSTCEILQERGKLIGLNFWLGRYYRAELYKTSSQLVITYYLLLFIARYEYQNRPTSDERRAIIDIYSSGSWRMRRPKSPNATAINNGFHKTESCDSLSQIKCE